MRSRFQIFHPERFLCHACSISTYLKTGATNKFTASICKIKTLKSEKTLCQNHNTRAGRALSGTTSAPVMAPKHVQFISSCPFHIILTQVICTYLPYSLDVSDLRITNKLVTFLQATGVKGAYSHNWKIGQRNDERCK